MIPPSGSGWNSLRADSAALDGRGNVASEFCPPKGETIVLMVMKAKTNKKVMWCQRVERGSGRASFELGNFLTISVSASPFNNDAEPRCTAARKWPSVEIQ